MPLVLGAVVRYDRGRAGGGNVQEPLMFKPDAVALSIIRYAGRIFEGEVGTECEAYQAAGIAWRVTPVVMV